MLWSRLLHANQGHPAQLKASINSKLAVVSRQRQQQQLQGLNSCRNIFCYTKATLGCSLISQGGRVFDLAQISRWIPFLTQASHLSWLGTSTRSNWLVTLTPHPHETEIVSLPGHEAGLFHVLTSAPVLESLFGNELPLWSRFKKIWKQTAHTSSSSRVQIMVCMVVAVENKVSHPI